MRPDLGIATNPADPFDLRARRVHEVEGRGRRAFALFQAARHPGPLVWILPSHAPELPMLRGLPRGVGERLHLFRPMGETDLLWCIEEALRAVPVSLVLLSRKNPSLADRRPPVATRCRGRAHHRFDVDPARGGQQCHRDTLGLRASGQPACGLDSASMGP